MSEQPNPGGRPTKYEPAFCEKAHKLAAEGATDIEIADALGVHVATYYRWKAEHPEFCESTRLGKEAADDRVEASLYHRAVGYSHDAVKIFMPAGAEEPVVAPYREHYAPDTTAASLWLRNRRPDKWRDRRELEMQQTPLDRLSPDELRKLEAALNALPDDEEEAARRSEEADSPPAA